MLCEASSGHHQSEGRDCECEGLRLGDDSDDQLWTAGSGGRGARVEEVAYLIVGGKEAQAEVASVEEIGQESRGEVQGIIVRAGATAREVEGAQRLIG